MPLTFAHPAAVLLFRRTSRLSFSALVIGSMAPDFSKFLTLSPAAHFGHSVAGVFWFCLPAGLASLVFFHGFLKKPVFLLLPCWLQAKLLPFLRPYLFCPMARFLTIIFSLVLGAFTHLFWDAFTHADGWFVERFTFFSSVKLEWQGQAIGCYKMLQHGSTMGGISFLAWAARRFLQSAPVHSLQEVALLSEKTKRVFVIFAVGMALFGAVLFGVMTNHADAFLGWIRIFAGRAAVAASGIFFLELVTFSFWIHFWKEKMLAKTRQPLC